MINVSGLIRASKPGRLITEERIDRGLVKKESDRTGAHLRGLLFMAEGLYIMLRWLVTDSNKNIGLEA